MGLITELQARGLLVEASDERLDEMLPKLDPGAPSEHRITAYCGFDPTAESMTIGNLMSILALMRLQKYGHKPIAVVGGATGMIGDPSGKSAERVLLSADVIEKNCANIKTELARFLDFDDRSPSSAILVNNADWLAKLTFIDFLRDVGKYFNIAYMLGKESVRIRLETGLSYTEFTYMIMQSYDFYHLHKNYNCVLQIGGSDQYGNITAGIELIRKLSGKPAYGYCGPLVTDSQGRKIGKSESGAIYLNASKTSVYKFYQYWLNMPDADVERFLKYFTFYSLEEIATLVEQHNSDPGKRSGQRALAEAVTDLVHGKANRCAAEAASKILFGGDPTTADVQTLALVAAEIPVADLAKDSLSGDGVAVIDAALQAAVAPSKGELNRTIEQGGLYVNGQRVVDRFQRLTSADLLAGSYTLLKKGSKQYYLISWK